MDLDAERCVQRLGRDHQALLQLLEGIVKAAASPTSEEALEEAILGFAGQLSDHIAAEQELMHTVSYPSAEPHVAAHDRLLQEVSDLLPSRAHSSSRDEALEGARGLELAMYQHVITWDWNLLDYVTKVRQEADDPV